MTSPTPVRVPRGPRPVPLRVAPEPAADETAVRRLDTDAVRRRELGGFLRSRRERIAPRQVGLPRGGRRRTPGLRREEVAQLAGVGVTWYTWLEQGRDIHASQQVLDAIARTLMFDPHERAHLFTLAGAPGRRVEAECQNLPETVPQLLDQLHPFPACVQNGRYDLLAYNRAYNGLLGDLSNLPFEERNCLWLAFTRPQWRESVVDWELAVSRMVAQYRAAMAEHVGEPPWKCLVRRLQQASPEFAELWGRHEMEAAQNVTKRFLHPKLGMLRFRHTSMWLSQGLGTRILTYTPLDGQTAAKLPHLA